MKNKLISYFLQGLLYIAPISIVIYIVYALFNFMDNILQNLLTEFFDIKIPGLGLLILVIFIMFIGFLGKTIIADPLKKLFKTIIEKVPFLKFIYAAFDDLIAVFVGKDKKFNKPVLVKMNRDSDIEKLGFITDDNLDFLPENDKVAVYFPHSYNFSGELFIVPKSQIKRIDVKSSELMKFIVSGGVTGISKENNPEV
ncbi:MAG: DUF502 domain-containing protein [Flavobacteriaceae bacterium]|nr:DUF502 domain-containing protein [Flavobacteriaceae bacterium]